MRGDEKTIQYYRKTAEDRTPTTKHPNTVPQNPNANGPTRDTLNILLSSAGFPNGPSGSNCGGANTVGTERRDHAMKFAVALKWRRGCLLLLFFPPISFKHTRQSP